MIGCELISAAQPFGLHVNLVFLPQYGKQFPGCFVLCNVSGHNPWFPRVVTLYLSVFFMPCCFSDAVLTFSPAPYYLKSNRKCDS